MNTETKSLEYNYFTARMLGWNGNRSRVIAEATGCWPTEDEAYTALQEVSDKKRTDWANRNGIDSDDAATIDGGSGWLSDYQRTTVEFKVIPTVDGKLDHSKSQNLAIGQLPEWPEEIRVSLTQNGDGLYSREFPSKEAAIVFGESQFKLYHDDPEFMTGRCSRDERAEWSVWIGDNCVWRKQADEKLSN